MYQFDSLALEPALGFEARLLERRVVHGLEPSRVLFALAHERECTVLLRPAAPPLCILVVPLETKLPRAVFFACGGASPFFRLRAFPLHALELVQRCYEG
jgi:hypothetical protein